MIEPDPSALNCDHALFCSHVVIAERFSVGSTVVGKLVLQRQDLGTVAPLVHPPSQSGH